MAKIICIESSTEVCSVALANKGVLVDLMEDRTGQNHSRLLTGYIDDILKRNQWLVSEIDAIAVSQGPGSYTGLRIGVSAAKGLCFGLNIPMIAICPLQSMTSHVLLNTQQYTIQITDNDRYFPMIDARRMEVYTAIFDANNQLVTPVEAKVVDSGSFGAELDNHACYFFGNGAMKCADTIQHPNARFVDGVIASAVNMIPIAEKMYADSVFVDVAYFEPFYLKDFIATTPKNSVLGVIA